MLDINIHLEQLFGLLTLLVTLYLGATIIFQDRKSATNRLFFFMSLIIAAYAVTNYISLHPPGGRGESQLFWIRVVMATCAFFGPTLLLLVLTFPDRQWRIASRYYVPLIALALLTSAASLSTLVFQSIDYPNGEPVPTPGYGMPLFILDFTGLLLVSFIVLLVRYRRANKEDRASQAPFVFGTMASFSFFAVSSFISVIAFKSSNTVFLGPPSFAILMFAIAYAIVKHQLFGVRVLTTRLLTGLLWIVLGARLLSSDGTGQAVENGLVFVLSIFLGYGLLRSMEKEVQMKVKEQERKHAQEMHAQEVAFFSLTAKQLQSLLSGFQSFISEMKKGRRGRLPPAVISLDQDNRRMVTVLDAFASIVDNEKIVTCSYEKVDMAALISEVVATFESAAKAKDLSIVWHAGELPSAVLADREKIRHALVNMIDNALKYSSRGIVRVSAEIKEKGVAVEVTDQGAGFSPFEGKKLFHKFYRGVYAREHGIGGTGLGLYISKMFIEAHGGYVWVTSPGPKQGAEFGFWIPFRPSAERHVENEVILS